MGTGTETGFGNTDGFEGSGGGAMSMSDQIMAANGGGGDMYGGVGGGSSSSPTVIVDVNVPQLNPPLNYPTQQSKQRKMSHSSYPLPQDRMHFVDPFLMEVPHDFNPLESE